ncbi:Alpha/Beta hydrolase protein [Radiomyces spectabilis]|uniref:Alpha/Beta hydrolase protein n=1 Tax=Radiomyces spectabilis TaxID=64574 RepID=UPI002220C811|nr:Alpha/Beta hydrolase protein [Radiomyces spectabilis]KAI8377654.1 Alpha/Beta hydrolase protein [Radiomyces spectabilis]
MPTLFTLTKVALVATLFSGVTLAEPQGHFFKQPVDGLTNIWHQTQDLVHDVVDNVQHVVNDVKSEFVTAFSHPAFPQYTMRYKRPNTICDPDVKQISGYLDVGNDKHFFFWFFESRDKPQEDPLVLWLNGGPGCSSLTGLFMELGPCTVNKEGNDTVVNKYSWNSNANIMFLDQPLNVGYSHGSGGATNSIAAAEDVYAFLQLFFKEFSEYAHLDFHIAGESYAGHYIPAIGGVIHRSNKGQYLTATVADKAHTLSSVNLKSLLIGNGLTDPLVQYKYYSKMACENSYGPVLDERTCRSMDRQYPACARLIQNCYDSQSVFACLPAAMKCNKDQIQPYQQTGMNPYDVREKCKGGNGLCYEILDSVQTYLNRKEIMETIGAETEGYKSCNMEINFRFNMAGDWMRPYVEEVPPLLEDGIRILIYAGDADFICNWMGNKAWTLELPWSGKKEFASANDTEWYSAITGKHAGDLRQTKDGRFAFLRVFGAGHMVPYDQPESGLDMLNAWIQDDLQ